MNRLPVTVVIPTFNRRTLLERALNSVLRQSRGCSEIIVVDDGSTDMTAELARGADPILRMLHTKNRGPAAARNLGIMASTQPFIAFLDSDDHWRKRKLEKQFALLSRGKFLVSHTKEKWLRRGRHLNQKRIHIPRHGDIFDHCLQLCAVGMSTVMVRREIFDLVGYFDESLRCCEDYDLWLRTAVCHPFLLVDEVLTVKEGGREDQVSFQYRVGMDALRIRSICKLLAEELPPQKRRQALRELIRKMTIYGQGCCRHGKESEGRRLLAEAARYRSELARLDDDREQKKR